MTIRNAREGDFVECVLLAKRAWPEFKEREAVYHIFCRFFTETCFVSEEDGKVQAFLLGFMSQVDRHEAYIHLIVVDGPTRRRGLARKLYQRFFEAVRGMSAKRVRLTVDPANSASLAFHKSLGFQPDLSRETIQIGSVYAAKNYNGLGLHMVPFVKQI